MSTHTLQLIIILMALPFTGGYMNRMDKEKQHYYCEYCGTLLLRILRKEVPRCPPTHLRHLSPSSRWQQQRSSQALRRKRKAGIHLQVLRQEVPQHHGNDRRAMRKPSQRYKQRGTCSGIVVPIYNIRSKYHAKRSHDIQMHKMRSKVPRPRYRVYGYGIFHAAEMPEVRKCADTSG